MYESVKGYLALTTNTEGFEALQPEDQDKAIFSAMEILKDLYPRHKTFSDRAVALQTLFMLEGEEEDFSKMMRHGIKSAGVKGVSVSFETFELVSPIVRAMIGEPSKVSGAGVGGLI